MAPADLIYHASDPYFHGGAVVKIAGSRYSGHKITIQREDPMDVTISIPDDMAHHLQEKWGDDLSRRALESLALEAYRERLIGESRLQRWLGLPTRMEAHRFLKEHGVPLHYTLEDLERDRQTHRQLGL